MTSAPLPSVPRVGHHHHESFAAPAALNPIVRRSRRPNLTLCSGPVRAGTNPVRGNSFGEDQVVAAAICGRCFWLVDPTPTPIDRWLPILKEPATSLMSSRLCWSPGAGGSGPRQLDH